MRLRGSPVSLNDQDSPAFVGRRQTALACRAETELEFSPAAENDEAGLVIRGNDENHYELGVTQRDGKRQVFFRRVLAGKTVEPVRYADLPDGSVRLRIDARPLEYEFFYQSASGESKSLGNAATADLSSERIGGFTGVYFGMYATGNGQAASTPADFAWFDYEILRR